MDTKHPRGRTRRKSAPKFQNQMGEKAKASLADLHAKMLGRANHTAQNDHEHEETNRIECEEHGQIKVLPPSSRPQSQIGEKGIFGSLRFQNQIGGKDKQRLVNLHDQALGRLERALRPATSDLPP